MKEVFVLLKSEEPLSVLYPVPSEVMAVFEDENLANLIYRLESLKSNDNYEVTLEKQIVSDGFYKNKLENCFSILNLEYKKIRTYDDRRDKYHENEFNDSKGLLVYDKESKKKNSYYFASEVSRNGEYEFKFKINFVIENPLYKEIKMLTEKCKIVMQKLIDMKMKELKSDKEVEKWIEEEKESISELILYEKSEKK